MNIDTLFPSSYLKAEDLAGRRHRLAMAKVVQEEIGGEPKVLVYFQGAKKGLVLNKTNAYVLADAFGTETDGWVGQVAELYPTKVNFQGRLVDAIRLEPVVGKATKQAEGTLPIQTAERPNGRLADDLNDSIPF